MKDIAMTRIIVEIDDNKAAILEDKAKKFGLLPEQFVTASIEDLISQPDPDFEAAMRKVLSKNQELYERLAWCAIFPFRKFLNSMIGSFPYQGAPWHSRYKRPRICRQPTSSNIRSKGSLPWYSYKSSCSMFFLGYESSLCRWQQKSWACCYGNVSYSKWAWNNCWRRWARAYNAWARCRKNDTYKLFRMAK